METHRILCLVSVWRRPVGVQARLSKHRAAAAADLERAVSPCLGINASMSKFSSFRYHRPR